MAEPQKPPVDWVIGDTFLTEMFLLDLQGVRNEFDARQHEAHAGHIFDLFDGTGVTCSVQRPEMSLAQDNYTNRKAAAVWMGGKVDWLN
jgi:hypothetical protein